MRPSQPWDFRGGPWVSCVSYFCFIRIAGGLHLARWNAEQSIWMQVPKEALEVLQVYSADVEARNRMVELVPPGHVIQLRPIKVDILSRGRVTGLSLWFFSVHVRISLSLCSRAHDTSYVHQSACSNAVKIRQGNDLSLFIIWHNYWIPHTLWIIIWLPSQLLDTDSIWLSLWWWALDLPAGPRR